MPAPRPQSHKGIALRVTGEQGFVGGDAQQHLKGLGLPNRAAAANHRCHETFAKLPLRHLVIAGTQVVQDGVELVVVLVGQG